MTEMLQKTENVANNIANKNSQDLTSQWRKGKLPEGEYYVKTFLNKKTTERYFTRGGFEHQDVKEVLAPVPTFKEWKTLKASYEISNDANLKQATWMVDMEKENAQLKKQINHLLKTQARQFVDNQKLQVKAEKAKDVVNIDTARQIKQLKELLKDARNVLKMVDTYYGDYDSTKGFLIVERIDEVLK